MCVRVCVRTCVSGRVRVSRGCAMTASTGRWEFEKNIGTGGFGVVKLFVNKVRAPEPRAWWAGTGYLHIPQADALAG